MISLFFLIAVILQPTTYHLQPRQAFAHVVVKPAEVKVGAFQTFNVSVPVEKEIPTVALKVVIPSGLKYITPTVKQGWTINVVKEGEGESAVVKEINWQYGSIPAGQRDDFTFSAQVPEVASELKWKAYQTYADGTVVAWEAEPTDSEEKSDSSGPYSTTAVVDDSIVPAEEPEKQDGNLPLLLSVLALGLSGASIWMQTSKKQAKKGK